MDTQTISRKHLKLIYNTDICSGWKNKITETLNSQSFEDVITVDNKDVLQAYSEANVEQKKMLKKYFTIITPKKISDQVNGWEDILKLSGIKEKELNLIVYPKTKEDKCLNATKRIFCITKVYNQGWVPDFTNSEYKYYPYKYFSGGRWVSCSNFGGVNLVLSAGVYFKSSPLAVDALEKFPDIYDDYFMIKTR